MIKKIRNKICVLMAPLVFYIFRIFKIKKNKIVVVNGFGKGYGDNAKYICDELKKDDNLDIVWLVNNKKDSSIPSEIRKVKINTIKAIYELVTSKIWIDNFRKPLYVKKRKNQFYIQLWHGSTMLKKIEYDVIDKLTKYYVKSMIHDNNMTDLMISNSEFFTQKCRETFRYDRNVLKVGVPREDVLINNHILMNKTLRKKLNLKKEKILLYAPTFRNEFTKETFDVDFHRILSKLEKNGDKWIVFVRLHPNISDKATLFEYNEKIQDFSSYPDMQELIAISDLVITDYSSIMFEAMEINKRVILYANDFDSYVDERGFYFDFKELPFLLAKNNDELFEFIDNSDDYIKKYDKFKKRFGFYDCHNSAVEISTFIKTKVINGEDNE